MKTMEIKDFVAQGYLNVLNEVLKPEGLELSTTVRADGTMELIHVFDYRPEPEAAPEPEIVAEPEPVDTPVVEPTTEVE